MTPIAKLHASHDVAQKRIIFHCRTQSSLDSEIQMPTSMDDQTAQTIMAVLRTSIAECPVTATPAPITTGKVPWPGTFIRVRTRGCLNTVSNTDGFFSTIEICFRGSKILLEGTGAG